MSAYSDTLFDTLRHVANIDGRRVVAESEAQRLRKALERVRGHLLAAQVQRSPLDDKIIAEHIDAALEIVRGVTG